MSVERYFRSGLAPSTQNCYDSAKCRFLHFCKRTGLSPLPLSENLLCRYMASLADEGQSPKTIKSYLSATRHLQIAMSLPDPRMGEMARLEQVIKGAKREYAKRNPETRVRLPITPDILLKLRSVWSRDAKDLIGLCFGQRVVSVFMVSYGRGKLLYLQRQDTIVASISIWATYRLTMLTTRQ